MKAEFKEINKDINLSEKLIDCHCGCGQKKAVVHQNNIKEFIKIVQEEVFRYAEKKDREDIWIGVRKSMGVLRRRAGKDFI